jgi:Fic family protein
MARALQTFVLAADGVLHPVFSSIEEWLGRNTEEYYQVLALTAQGRWSPEQSAGVWVRFCLKAHYQQAATLIRGNDEYARLYEVLAARLEREKLPERATLPIFNAAQGFRVTNARYRADAEVKDLTASRDLKRLCDIGLLVASGEKRGRVYRASEMLSELRNNVRAPKSVIDPYELVARRMSEGDEPLLPGF